MSYIGDIRLGDTIDHKFTTRAFATAVPTTLAGSPVISAYVGNGTTEITAGITLTVDFDSRTGLNNVRVVATSGNGFATATNVYLVITTGTVGGTSVVGEVIGEFSIENRSALMPTTGGRTLVVDAAGLADANAVKMGPTGAGTAQTARDIGASVLLSNGTGTGQVKIASGYLAMTWADIAAPTTTVNLSGTTIATTQKVDIETIKTNPVINLGTVSFPTTATLASTTNITSATGVDITKILGTAISTPATAGILDVNAKNINNVSTTSVNAVNAKIGTSNSIQFDVNGDITANAKSINGISTSAVTTVLAVQGLSVADQITTVVGLTASDVGAIKAKTDNLPVAVKKNTALAKFMFKMVLSSDHVSAATGLTVACQRSIDGGAFSNCNTATATEISAGWYYVDLAASDLNGNTIALKFTSATADQRDVMIVTQT